MQVYLPQDSSESHNNINILALLTCANFFMMRENILHRQRRLS